PNKRTTPPFSDNRRPSRPSQPHPTPAYARIPMQTTHLPTLAPPPDALNLIEPSDSMHLAYDRVTQLLATHPIERLEPINVEVPNLVTLVLGAIPKIMRHRALLAQLVTFDLTFVDELEQYALALGYAHAIRRAADLS